MKLFPASMAHENARCLARLFTRHGGAAWCAHGAGGAAGCAEEVSRARGSGLTDEPALSRARRGEKDFRARILCQAGLAAARGGCSGRGHESGGGKSEGGGESRGGGASRGPASR